LDSEPFYQESSISSRSEHYKDHCRSKDENDRKNYPKSRSHRKRNDLLTPSIDSEGKTENYDHNENNFKINRTTPKESNKPLVPLKQRRYEYECSEKSRNASNKHQQSRSLNCDGPHQSLNSPTDPQNQFLRSNISNRDNTLSGSLNSRKVGPLCQQRNTYGDVNSVGRDETYSNNSHNKELQHELVAEPYIESDSFSSQFDTLNRTDSSDKHSQNKPQGVFDYRIENSVLSSIIGGRSHEMRRLSSKILKETLTDFIIKRDQKEFSQIFNGERFKGNPFGFTRITFQREAFFNDEILRKERQLSSMNHIINFLNKKRILEIEMRNKDAKRLKKLKLERKLMVIKQQELDKLIEEKMSQK